jgi:Fatty acid hydroxylase
LTSRTLGTDAGHRRHHLDPPAIEWLLLRGVDAAVFSPVVAVLTLAWSVPTLVLVGRILPGQALLAPTVTALLCAELALWHYEWTHLLIHTGYRPHTAPYRRLARNHRKHHYRNERFWLGITSDAGDRLFGTYPADSASVPLSETARTLH